MCGSAWRTPGGDTGRSATGLRLRRCKVAKVVLVVVGKKRGQSGRPIQPVSRNLRSHLGYIARQEGHLYDARTGERVYPGSAWREIREEGYEWERRFVISLEPGEDRADLEAAVASFTDRCPEDWQIYVAYHNDPVDGVDRPAAHIVALAHERDDLFVDPDWVGEVREDLERELEWMEQGRELAWDREAERGWER